MYVDYGLFRLCLFVFETFTTGREEEEEEEEEEEVEDRKEHRQQNKPTDENWPKHHNSYCPNYTVSKLCYFY